LLTRVMCLIHSRHSSRECKGEFETIIKKVRSDKGSEFKNIRVDELCDECGIRHQFLAKYTL
jgi:hypothetical protein